MNNILSVQAHKICNIFLTAGKQLYCFNDIVFILVAKISSKKICEKMENNSTLEKILLVCNRNTDLLRLVEGTFDSKVTLRWMRKKTLIILKCLQKKSSPFFVLFVCRCWHLSCQISIESVWKIVICSLNVLMTVIYLKFFSIL